MVILQIFTSTAVAILSQGLATLPYFDRLGRDSFIIPTVIVFFLPDGLGHLLAHATARPEPRA